MAAASLFVALAGALFLAKCESVRSLEPSEVESTHAGSLYDLSTEKAALQHTMQFFVRMSKVGKLNLGEHAANDQTSPIVTPITRRRSATVVATRRRRFTDDMESVIATRRRRRRATEVIQNHSS